MNIDELKRHIQAHMSDGLITLVGSGLSAAQGLPTMSQLAAHLLQEMPKVVTESARSEWTKVESSLKSGASLEAALKEVSPESELVAHLVTLTADCILPHEQNAIEELFSGKRALPFADLLKHLLFSNERHIVITTNYDRLIELAVETSGHGIDTLFDGKNYGKFDKAASKESLNRRIMAQTKVGIKVKSRPHVVVLKPHGSFDWYAHGANPVRFSLPIKAERLMIVPGGQKYRRGYDSPFDQHRAEANAAIDKAARFLVIGYGFNDDHLETHLRAELRKGKPCLILTRDLTDNIRSILSTCPAVMAVSHASVDEKNGTRVVHGKVDQFFPDLAIWDLGSFIKEILEP